MKRIQPDRSTESLEEKIQRVIKEEITIVSYDSSWPEAFLKEKKHLLSSLPQDLLGRIEHFGSTAVPGLSAKPVVDILVEVNSLDEAKKRIAPILEAEGYDYFWRPTSGDDVPPFYAWFIKRHRSTMVRTHHIHMVENHFTEHWDRLLFRDALIENPSLAAEYEELKVRLAAGSRYDRVAYTLAKTEFITRVTDQARKKERPPGE